MAKRNDPKDGNPTPETPANPEAAGSRWPSYVTAAARLPGARILGAPRVDENIMHFQSSTPVEDGPIEISDTTSVPGIVVLHYMPTLGVSRNSDSPLNRAAYYELNKIRCQISGARKYQPADHMIYRVCVDAMRELYAYVKRAYKMVKNYSATNLYKPKHVMTAMGLDFKEWDRESANVYQWLENHAGALSAFPTVPIGTISARRESFNSGVFLDGDSGSSQMYVFNQMGFFSYEKVDEVKGLTVRYPAGGKPSDYFDLWDDLMYALNHSADVYDMTCDIRRAFPDTLVTALIPPERGEEVACVKLDGALVGIMNAGTLMTKTDDIGSLTWWAQLQTIADAMRIVDNDGDLLTGTRILGEIPRSINGNVAWGMVQTAGWFNHLNFPSSTDIPDVEDVVQAVRLKPVIDNKVTFEYRAAPTDKCYCLHELQLKSVATEAIMYTSCFVIEDDNIVNVCNPSSVTLYDDIEPYYVVDEMAYMSSFDWAFPRVYSNISSKLGIVRSTATCEDVQTYIPVSKDNVSQLHENILLAEFGLPSK